MSFVLFGTVSQCCDATSILDGIVTIGDVSQSYRSAAVVVSVAGRGADRDHSFEELHLIHSTF